MTCNQGRCNCGKEITFKVIGGRKRPIHEKTKK